ncbi:hypothetical protein BSPWISOXPB_9986 [uncultured Gammaproteobacteria bacterium]|nr:hypothetical protein BSPWISOXPB_9986 [uncultured Gammaproteobacteria bacterium]
MTSTIASHKGLKGEIDTRLLTKVGRAKIKEDLKLSQLLTQALLELADKSTSLVNNKEQGQTGFFQNATNKKSICCHQKIALDLYNMHSTNEISAVLNNTYPPLSIKSKQRILNSLIKAKNMMKRTH